MHSSREPAPVVVGVHGSASGRDALDWAVAEAATRGLPLRIVHACPLTVPSDPWGSSGPAGEGEGVGGAWVLREAVEHARLVDPDIAVTTRLVFAAPVPAILGQRAALVVLGGRGQGRARAVLAGSVSVAVSARAMCPVVVIHPRREAARGPSAARVVVGLDGSTLCAPVLDYALEAAAQRGIGLTAVHACAPPGSADGGAGGDAAPTMETVAGSTVATAFAACRARYPEVDLVPRLVGGPAGAALVAESAGAALVVVGSRGRGALAGALFGSVNQAVLRHATSPVAVIRCARARLEPPPEPRTHARRRPPRRQAPRD